MDHQQGVFAGAGALDPDQRVVYPEPGLVEPGCLAGSDTFSYLVQEAIEPPSGSGGNRRDRAIGNRDVEQLRQRLRGALLGAGQCRGR